MKIPAETLAKGRFLIPALVAGWSFLAGNENIFPTALVMTLVCLVLLIDGHDRDMDMARVSPLGAAGRAALIAFAVPVALSSLALSVFLPGYAAPFLHVTAQDLHGYAYMTAVLLVICLVFIAYFRISCPATAYPGCGRPEGRV
jgi:hypothetical protein